MENHVEKTVCAPPVTLCCEDFASNFGPGKKRFYKDPESGLVKERAGGRTLIHCPFCGAEIDPVVHCAICKARVLFSRAWIDNGRYLCSRDGKAVLNERITRTDLGDAA